MNRKGDDAMRGWRFQTMAMALTMVVASGARAADGGDFAAFDARARAGERLSVVFFGASLTWGANASDPARTSYRARMAAFFEERYPRARFAFHDAAIGGTGSTLGVFRLDRDVVRWKPDLVFLDFTANDDIASDSPDPAAAYETILRRLTAEAGVPVVQVVFPFRWDIDRGRLSAMKRREQHRALSQAYGTGFADAVASILEGVEAGGETLDAIWPHDAVHPGDHGYQLFAQAAWRGFEAAVAEGRRGRIPEKPLFGDTFQRARRVRLADLDPLPAGWSRGRPALTAVNHDWLMSRWLDDLAVAANFRAVTRGDGLKSDEPVAVAPLRLQVDAAYILLFGQASAESGRFRVRLDGKPVTVRDGPGAGTEVFEANRWDGNGFLLYELASGLATEAEHLLEIELVFEKGKARELRLESLCVAGGRAEVRLATAAEAEPDGGAVSEPRKTGGCTK